jgi:hypothetical protein
MPSEAAYAPLEGGQGCCDHRDRLMTTTTDHRRALALACLVGVVVGAAAVASAVLVVAAPPRASSNTTPTTTTNQNDPINPPIIPPECVTALGGGLVGPGGSIHPFAARQDVGCRSALAAYGAQGGAYWRDVAAAVEAAYPALGIGMGMGVKSSSVGSRGVVIFDIDETALSNAPLSSSPASDEQQHQLLFAAGGARRVRSSNAPALAPTLKLYRKLQDAGLSAAFVTGRGEASRADTERNLKSAGYGGRCGGDGGDSGSNGAYCWLSLTLRKPGDARPASVYKPEARAAVAAATGLPVVASVGDQWSDLNGGGGCGCGGGGGEDSQAAYVAIKLPNPFYYIL